MTAIAMAPPPRSPPREMRGIAASLALHGMAALAVALLAQWQTRPSPEPQVVEIVIEQVAAAAPVAPEPKSEPEVRTETPEPVPAPLAEPDQQATVDLPISEPPPMPSFDLEPAPPPRRKPMAEPTQPAPIPVAPRLTEPEARLSTAPAAVAPSPAAPPAMPQAEPRAPRYGAILLAWLERYRDYPRAARLRRQEGEVVLRLTVDRTGRLLAAEIARPSGVDALDQAALDTARRAAPMPPVPADEPGDRLILLVPVLFALAKG